MSLRRFFLCAVIFTALIGALPLAARAQDGLPGEVTSPTALRTAPSLAGRPLANLQTGDKVTVTGRFRAWFRLTFNGQTGYALADRIRVQGDANRLPDIPPAEALPPTAAPTATPAAVTTATSWFGETVLYSLFVRSFRDSNGDGIGDLRGVIDGLDYLQGLGVNGLWLLPIFASPSYHGYDVTDYQQINPQYGTKDDLLTLIAELKRRGMYLLLDLPVNHTSNQHPFFKDAFGKPTSLFSQFYVWSNAAQTDYLSFNGFRPMPELNFDSRAVRDYVTRMALYWLDPNGDGDPSDGIDGYRLDVAKDVPADYWAELRTAMNKVNPRAVLLGEVWAEGRIIADFLRGDGMNAAFDFPAFNVLAGPNSAPGEGLLNGVGEANVLGLTMRALDAMVAPGSVLARFSHNHDTNRLMSIVRGDVARAKMAAVWLLTAPGVPTVYYGEEIGMAGVKANGPVYYDEYRREPFDWYAAESGPGMTYWFRPGNRNNGPNDGISVEEQQADPDSVLNTYRALLRLRAEHPALRSRQVQIVRDSGPLYVVQRWADDALYIVAINFTRDVQPFWAAVYAAAGGQQYDSARAEVLLSAGYQPESLLPAGYVIVRLPR